MKYTETFFQFCMNLKGYDLYINDNYVPRFIAYWKGLLSDDILNGNTRIKLKDRILNKYH